MGTKHFIVYWFLLIGSSLWSVGYAVEIKVTPMSADETAFFLRNIRKITYSTAEGSPILTFTDVDNMVVKEYTIADSVRITFELENNATSIDNILHDNVISVYPNPTADMLHINGLSAPTEVCLYDLQGKKVLSETIINLINVSQIKKGTYILKVNNQCFKMIIQ